MDFYDRIGVAALGSRLRRLGDKLADDAAAVYTLYGTDLQPRWFPVVHVLGEREAESVTAIAEEIGHTHASVSQIVSEMVALGYAAQQKGQKDGRKTYVSLTPKGRAAQATMKEQLNDVRRAVNALLDESTMNLWLALGEFETALSHRSLYQRVQQQKKQREVQSIRIVTYESRHAEAFKRLNEEWITTYFEIEEADRRVLNDPENNIIGKGGHILVALLDEEAIGVCALIPHDAQTYELAKMAVSPTVQGKGVGWLLGQAAVEKARACQMTRLYLESNTALAPAISLYRKLGFQETRDEKSPYQRCNIRMEMPVPVEVSE